MLDRVREGLRTILFTVIGAAIGLVGSSWYFFTNFSDIIAGSNGMLFVVAVVIFFCTIGCGYIGYDLSRRIEGA